ncbi:probable salivary secreted peptide [Nasonia vitripennis]|uniref:Salivary secreted peptide n=1 Tax=Nasonia vitripennis TaxID=7425 RepID=A0A7M7T7Q1_NASVI|nr:probable salivary secreted peptide [Nasonia vitripennis]
MAPRRLLLLALLIASLAAVLTEKLPNSLIVGDREPGDHLMQREFVMKGYKWLRSVKLTKTFTGSVHSKITQVQLLDQNEKGNGATAAILSGGPGDNFVTVQFKSVRGHGVNYVVKLYGK